MRTKFDIYVLISLSMDRVLFLNTKIKDGSWIDKWTDVLIVTLKKGIYKKEYNAQGGYQGIFMLYERVLVQESDFHKLNIWSQTHSTTPRLSN